MKLSLPEKIVFAIALLAAAFTIGYFVGRSGGESFVVETEKQITQSAGTEVSDNQPEVEAPTDENAEDKEEAGGIININTADSELLQTLPGIGEVLAGRIIAYRENNGNFVIIDEITDVDGIGDKLFEDISDLITVD